MKAEFEYQRISLLLAFGFVVLINIGIFTAGRSSVEKDVPGILAVMTVTLALIWLLRFFRLVKEKNGRLHMGLPLSRRDCAHIRTSFTAYLWLLFVLVFLVVFVTARPQDFDLRVVWFVMSTTGVVLAVNALPFLHRDLVFWLAARRYRSLLTIVYAVVTWSGVLVFSSEAMIKYFPSLPLYFLLPVRSDLGDFAWSQAGAVICILLGLGLVNLGTLMFQRRRAYLE
jgi:hypothetical protein